MSGRLNQMADAILNGELYACINGKMLTKLGLLAWIKTNLGDVPDDPVVEPPVQYLPVKKEFNWGGAQWWVGKLAHGTVSLLVSFDVSDVTAEDQARLLAAQPEEVERQAAVRRKAIASATSGRRKSYPTPESYTPPRTKPSTPQVTDLSGDMRSMIENEINT